MSMRPLAAITGASTGIGFALARCCAQHGYDLLITADEPRIYEIAHELRSAGGRVGALQTDLATRAGVDRFYAAAQGRPIEALVANAGRRLRGAFLEQPFEDVRRAIETNISGTIYLLQKAAFDMRARGRGRILVAGATTDPFQDGVEAVCNATKSFIASFAATLRAELRDSGVTVTCLTPGATGQALAGAAGSPQLQGRMDDEGGIARAVFTAMQNGDAAVIGCKEDSRRGTGALTH